MSSISQVLRHKIINAATYKYFNSVIIPINNNYPNITILLTLVTTTVVYDILSKNN